MGGDDVAPELDDNSGIGEVFFKVEEVIVKGRLGADDCDEGGTGACFDLVLSSDAVEAIDVRRSYCFNSVNRESSIS